MELFSHLPHQTVFKSVWPLQEVYAGKEQITGKRLVSGGVHLCGGLHHWNCPGTCGTLDT
eukprot:3604831-Karenia_brevis.AAC.1